MKPARDIRQKELGAIHIAAKQLGLDRDAYEAMLWTVARVRSAADLDWAGRKRVLDHLAACGARIGGKRPATEWGFIDARPAHEQKRWRYLICLCRDAGIARGTQRVYCEGIARQMAGAGPSVDKPAPMWSGADLANIVNAMVYEVARIGRRGGRA